MLNAELNESARKVDDKFQAEIDEFTKQFEEYMDE